MIPSILIKHVFPSITVEYRFVNSMNGAWS